MGGGNLCGDTDLVCERPFESGADHEWCDRNTFPVTSEGQVPLGRRWSSVHCGTPDDVLMVSQPPLCLADPASNGPLPAASVGHQPFGLRYGVTLLWCTGRVMGAVP